MQRTKHITFLQLQLRTVNTASLYVHSNALSVTTIPRNAQFHQRVASENLKGQAALDLPSKNRRKSIQNSKNCTMLRVHQPYHNTILQENSDSTIQAKRRMILETFRKPGIP